MSVSETLAEENNPYTNDPDSSLSKAIEMLASGRVSLSEVARMFEAAIQKSDLGEGGHEAWILLGEVRGMDEREDLGLAALREGVQIAEENGGAGGVGLLVCILFLSITATSESPISARHSPSPIQTKDTIERPKHVC